MYGFDDNLLVLRVNSHVAVTNQRKEHFTVVFSIKEDLLGRSRGGLCEDCSFFLSFDSRDGLLIPDRLPL